MPIVCSGRAGMVYIMLCTHNGVCGWGWRRRCLCSRAVYMVMIVAGECELDDFISNGKCYFVSIGIVKPIPFGMHQTISTIFF